MKKRTKNRLISLILFLCIIATSFIYAKYLSSENRTITLIISKPIYTITLDNQGANISGTQSIYEKYSIGYYLDANATTEMTPSANGITVPDKTGYIYLGYYTGQNAIGTKYIDRYGKLTNNANTTNFQVDGTLYARWASDFTVSGNPTSWTNQDVTLTIVLTSGNYSDYDYSFDGGTTWQSSPSQTFSSNQDVHIKIRDHIDYTSEEKVVSITKIDKVPPVLTFNNSIEYNADSSTKTVTTLIATLDENTSIRTGTNTSDNLSGIDANGVKCYQNNNEITSTNSFTYPGRYAISCSVSDNAGNTTTESREVLVRWPTGAKYVLRKTQLDGANVVGTGKAVNSSISGLYQDDADTGLDTSLPFSSKYYYSGPSTDNNYISFGGYTYRILNLAVNDDIKLIGDTSSRNVRYSNRKIFESGSYADADDWNTWWNGKYIYYTDDNQYRTLSDNDASHIDEGTFYAGRFTKDATPTLAATINAERTSAVNLGADSAAFQSHFSFPMVSDFIKACNQMNAVYNVATTQSASSTFKTCSYLQTSDEQWTINSKNDTSTDNDYWVLDPTIAGNNRIVSRTYYYYENYRPVFYLKENTIISGLGTTGDIYTVQEDWSWFDSYQTVQ